MVVHINTYSNRATKWKAPLCSDTSNSNKLTHSFSALFPFCIEFHLTFFFHFNSRTRFILSVFHSSIHSFHSFFGISPIQMVTQFLGLVDLVLPFSSILFYSYIFLFHEHILIFISFCFRVSFWVCTVCDVCLRNKSKKNSHLCIVYGTRYRNVWSAFLSEVISMFKFI